VALGGWRYFIPQSEERSLREDDRDLSTEMQASGYVHVRTGSELAEVDLAATDRLLGMFAGSQLDFELDRQMRESDDPTLAEMTTAALAVLDQNEAGFYLVVEGGRIDRTRTRSLGRFTVLALTMRSGWRWITRLRIPTRW
jgi:alkaline phosphatase